MHEIAMGGAEMALLSALPMLDARFDLRVYVLEDADPKLVDRLDASVRAKLSIWKIPIYLLPFYLPGLLAHIRRFAPDIVISSLWKSAIIAALYKRFNKQTYYFILLHSSNFFHWFDRVFTRIGVQISDAVFADSNASASLATRITGKADHVYVLSYLTETNVAHHHGREFSGPKTFLFIGRIHPVKRVPLAIAAIAWLRDKGVDATLHIYGRDDGDLNAVKAAIAAYRVEEFVSLRGEIAYEAKRQLYASCNYYIQLSAQEGMAMSVAEAMQQGMLCFVTPVGGIMQYATDGHSAIFAYPEDAISWESSLNKLLEVLEDPMKCVRISEAAYETFRDSATFADSLAAAINGELKQT
jgi:Glycosyltransferase